MTLHLHAPPPDPPTEPPVKLTLDLISRNLRDLIDSLESMDRAHPTAVSGAYLRSTRIANARKLLRALDGWPHERN